MRIVIDSAMAANRELIEGEHKIVHQIDGQDRLVRRRDGVIIALEGGANLVISFTSPDVVRVRFAAPGQLERDSSYAIERPEGWGCPVTVRETADAIEVWASAGARVRVLRQPCRVTVFDEEGRVVVEDDPSQPPLFDAEDGSVVATKLRGEHEYYFGFGEKAFSNARNGLVTVMWNTDTYGYPPGTDPIYQSIPFFMALSEGRAYGLFLDNTYRSSFDMGGTDPKRYTFGAKGGELNYYVFTGGRERSPRAVLRDYTKLTGRAPLPPLWALGYHQSRWSYQTDSHVRELARRFRESQIPVDVIHLDIDYMDEYRVFTWNGERFPDAALLARDLAEAGVRLVVIVDPGVKVDENYSVYQEGQARSHFCQDADGDEFRGRVWPGVCAFPDFLDPEVRAWFGSLYGNYLDEGISGFWNDMNEPSVFPELELEPHDFHHPAKTFSLDVRHAGDGIPGDHARYHNVYGMQMARATFEGVKGLRPAERPFVLTRAGFAGVQRYAAVWTGDNVSSWEHLALSIPMLTSLSVSGVPFVGADVGGFSGEPSAELYARWLQAASLTPFFRSHTETGSKDQEPWSHGVEFERINRATINLRYHLLPYLYSLFHDHEETGAPVMRPLWFEYPSDPRTYVINDQFLAGRDILVAPVVSEGAIRRSVYFPSGDEWVDWWTGTRYEGRTEAEIDAPLDRLPLFVRACSSVLIQPIVQHTGEMDQVPLTITAVLGDAGESSFYEDAGNGYEYMQGVFSTISVSINSAGLSIVRSGSYRSPRPIKCVELLGVDSSPREIRVNGHVLDVAFVDHERRRLRLLLPGEDSREISVTLDGALHENNMRHELLPGPIALSSR
ncbi:MAG: glycoside hydrolase family 31 protein [Blastocatellia bacterium]